MDNESQKEIENIVNDIVTPSSYQEDVLTLPQRTHVQALNFLGVYIEQLQVDNPLYNAVKDELLAIITGTKEDAEITVSQMIRLLEVLQKDKVDAINNLFTFLKDKDVLDNPNSAENEKDIPSITVKEVLNMEQILIEADKFCTKEEKAKDIK